MVSAISRRSGNALGFLACAGLMGYALYAQYVLGLTPCPLCIFQRIATIVTGILFLVADTLQVGDRLDDRDDESQVGSSG